jgi:hypothetical protein
LLEAICTSRFAEAFRILDELRPALQLDPFLVHHLARLTHQIRCRVLQQYTKPFHSLRLSDMAQALGCKLSDLEVELARLIVDDTINARIDSHNKVCFEHCRVYSQSCTRSAMASSLVMKVWIVIPDSKEVIVNLGKHAGFVSKDDR